MGHAEKSKKYPKIFPADTMNITEQSFLYKEKLSKNNTLKEVHFVVKRTPFFIRLALNPDAPFDFCQAPLECALLYDESKKDVEAPTKPLEWVTRPGTDPKTAVVEFRVNVLTTQHQNSFFVIRLRLGKGRQALEVVSKPIKSVSKPEQVRRRQNISQAEETGCELAATSSSKKRVRSEELLDSLAAIHQQQQAQTEMLALLLSQSQQPKLTPQFYPPPPSTPTVQITFDAALTSLLEAFNNLPSEERPTKVRKITTSLSPQQHKNLSQLCSLLEPSSPEPMTPMTPTHTKQAPPPTIKPIKEELPWELLVPSLGESLVADFEQMDEEGFDNFSSTFRQWLTTSQ